MTEAERITRALGGDWRHGHGLAPCPVCQPEGRRDQRALSISDGGGRLLVHCHKGGCDVLGELRRRGHIEGRGQPSAPPEPAEAERRRAEEQRRDAQRLKSAHDLFAAGVSCEGTPAQTYLEARGIIDLRADAGAGLGLFEDLHGAADPASFAQSLKAAAGRTYGTAARAFLREVAANLPQVREGVAAARKSFLASSLPPGADGQVRRVADRFALVAAAGELATVLGVTGWHDGTAKDAAVRCFRDWLAERGGIGAGEVADAKARLRREIEVNGHSRWYPWHHDPRTVMRTNMLGYVRRAEDEQPDSAPTFFLHTSGVAELFKGLDVKAVLDGLAAEGVILRHEVTEKGEKVMRLNKPFKVPSEKTAVRLYQIDFAVLTGEGSGPHG